MKGRRQERVEETTLTVTASAADEEKVKGRNGGRDEDRPALSSNKVEE